MKKLGLFSIAFAFIANGVYAQGVTIGSNNPPDPSAVLDLQTSNRGFALPRITTTQRNAIANPVHGLQIYNTDTDCIEAFYALGGWKPVSCGCQSFPSAQFTPPAAYVNLPATFNAPSSNLSYAWTFQGGNPASSILSSPTVVWSTPGKYAVQLTVTDLAGCPATYTDSVVVTACQPISQTFTHCGKVGNTGPSQSDCNSAYGSGVVTVFGGIQEWTVPLTATYRIEAWGAAGGNNTNSGHIGGSGVGVRGDFQLTAGQVLRILVGQKGGDIGTNCEGGGGGGGTYVVLNGNPLVVAGGGGGAAMVASVPSVMNGTTSTAGQSGTTNGGNNGRGIGGTNGNGSTTWSGSGTGCGGGGFNTNGGTGSDGPEGGKAFVNGGNGGVQNRGGYGGFGGGGTGRHVGGGAGGYSGGGSGGYNSACNSCGGGGGGGSYLVASAINPASSDGMYDGASSFNGAAIQNLNQYNSSHGYVIITRVCQ